MSRLPSILSVVLVAAMLAVSIPPHRATPGRVARAHAQAATLVLNPSSGPAPSVGGNLSGSGWCNGGIVTVSSAPPGLATGSGATAGGNLSGSFTVSGSPGQLVTINVDAVCRVGTSTARANFRFDTSTPVPSATNTATPFPTPTNTATPTPALAPTSTASPTSTNTLSPTGTPTPGTTVTPAATNTRTAPPTPTPAKGATPPQPTPAVTPTPALAPKPGSGSVEVFGCTPLASAVTVKMTYAGGAAPPPSFVETNLPAVQGASGQLFTFALPPEAPGGTLFNLLPEVDDPACPPSASEPVLWDPAAADSASLFLPTGKSDLAASSHGQQVPGGDIVTWVTLREFKANLGDIKQLFRLSSSAKFDGLSWQVSLQPFTGAFDPIDPNPPGMLASGKAKCGTSAECTFLVDFGTFIPATKSATQAGSPNQSAWSSKVMGSLFEVGPLFQVAQGVVQAKGNSPLPPASAASPVLGSAAVSSGSPLGAWLSAPPKEFYFRSIPMAGDVLLGPQSNTVILRWMGPSDGPDLKNLKIVDCKTMPEDPICIAQLPKPPNYKVEILTYNGWIPPKDGHEGCFIVTETTTAQINPLLAPITYKQGQTVCPPKPKEPSFLEAIVNFVVDAVNWVANTYQKLKDEVIDLVSQFVPEALCNKSCIGTLLDAGLAALGIPPSLPNFDQLMNEGIDYLASTAAEQIGVPKAIQDLAEGPAKNLAIEQFKKTTAEQIKGGIEAGLAEMQKNLSSKVSWIANGVPIKPDPLGDYQPPALTFRVTRKQGAGACSGNISVSGIVSNSTSPGLKELDGKPWAWLYEGKSIPLPPLAEGESVTIPVTLKPRFSYGYPGAKYYSYNQAASGWSSLYYNGMAELSVLGGGCIGGDTLTVPADAVLLAATTSP